jgi:hypothetical protein
MRTVMGRTIDKSTCVYCMVKNHTVTSGFAELLEVVTLMRLLLDVNASTSTECPSHPLRSTGVGGFSA